MILCERRVQEDVDGMITLRNTTILKATDACRNVSFSLVELRFNETM